MALHSSYRRDMQENLNALAKGIVKYERPTASVDPVRIELSLQSGDSAEGEIRVTSPENETVTGLAISHNIRMRILNPEFSGAESSIRFVFDAGGIEPGEVMKGEICLLMDAGEFVVPYTVSILHGDIESDNGPVRNLFHFTNLAIDDFEKAREVFYSDAFAGLVESNDRQYTGVYRGFAGGKASDANFDSFLCAIKKKKPASYRVSGQYFEDGVFSFAPEGDERTEVLVDCDGWGYCDYSITSDAEFLIPEKDRLTASDFENKRAVIPVRIDSAKLHKGRNFGRLTFASDTDSFTADFCLRFGAEGGYPANVRLAQIYREAIVKTYIEHRIRNISRSTWEERFRAISGKLLELDKNNVESRLYRAHALLVSGRVGEAVPLIEKAENEAREAGTVVNAYRLFLAASASDDPEFIADCCRRVSRAYMENPEKDKLLWMLIQMDEAVASDNRAKLSMIRHHFDGYGVGPMLYLRSYEIMSAKPELLEQLGRFEIQVLNFAAKTGLFDKKLMNKASVLAGQERGYSPSLLSLMQKVYNETHTNESLFAVCTQLMKAERTDEEAFSWYSMAVEKDLNITRLIEYYMYSVPVDYAKELPGIVQLYFRYGADLPTATKALLYADIIRYTPAGKGYLADYRPQMLEFAKQQAAAGRVDDALAVIYKYFSDDDEFLDVLSGRASDIVFCHYVRCADPKVKYVIAIEDAFEKERRVEVEKGSAFVPVYGKTYELFGEYENGVRICGDDFDDLPLFDIPEYEDILEENEEISPGEAVYFSEKYAHEKSITNESYPYVLELVDAHEIRGTYKRPYMIKLLRHLGEDSSDASQIMDNIDMSALDSAGRVELMEFLMQRGVPGEVRGLIRRYGIGGMSPRLLMRLISSLEQVTENIADDFAIWICYECFKLGKYDEQILRYLCSYLEDTTKVLRSLWKDSGNFEIDTRELEERMLVQMMYTGAFVGEREDIFDSYERHVAKGVVEMAWITLNAHDYVVRDGLMDERFFDRLLKARRGGNELNNLCALALILFFSDEKNRHVGSEIFDDTAREAVIEYIRRFLAEKVVLEAFMSFTDIVPELSAYDGSVFVEHKADPDSTVTLHYRLTTGEEDDAEYERVTMKNRISGIFSARFVLFGGESLQYYISQENGVHSVITESVQIDGPKEIGDSRTGRYEVLNEMLQRRSRGEGETLINLMEVYRRRSFTTKRIFKPI